MAQISASDLAAKIDSTLLKPQTSADQIDRLCDEAIRFGFWGVCVNLFWLPRVAKTLDAAHGKVKAVSTVAFPTGAIPTQLKVSQARWAIDHGADEIDMVINLGALRDGQSQLVQDDIAAVAQTVHQGSPQRILKVILETAVLNKDQKILACQLAAAAGADFVKTSTGTHSAGGATAEDVALLAEHSAGMKVKAAGSIRDLPTALAMLQAGADRLGTSNAAEIISQLDV